MMNVPPEQAARLSYWDYTAMRAKWIDRHKTDSTPGEPVEPPTEEFVRARQAELSELGMLH